MLANNYAGSGGMASTNAKYSRFCWRACQPPIASLRPFR